MHFSNIIPLCNKKKLRTYTELHRGHTELHREEENNPVFRMLYGY